jgi:hypothetical protein
LHDSLSRVARDFRLHALCMDSVSHEIIRKLSSETLRPVKVEELLTPRVSSVRDRTTHGQFCWVCQPLICEFVLDSRGADVVTYLEADSLFFSNPDVLFTELGDNSVSLVPHAFSPGFDNTGEAGRFCVQFNAFRSDKRGRAVLGYWKSRCFEYTKDRPRSYPGQTSLNDWPERFEGVKVIENPGAGVAPWNIQHRTINIVDSVPHVDGVPVVFYHFHQYGRYGDGSHELGHYPLTRQAIDAFYKPYVHALASAERRVRAVDPGFRHQRTYPDNKSLGEILARPRADDVREYVNVLRRRLRGCYNVFPDQFFLEDREAP